MRWSKRDYTPPLKPCLSPSCTSMPGHYALTIKVFFYVLAVEEAGGNCLPCAVDIRDEEQVGAAVEQAVAQFGGIDVLINNASAIHLTGTSDTPMKR